MTIPDWNEILSKCTRLERWNNPNHLGLRNKETDLPVSISESEFKFIVEWGRKHKRKSAIDAYTGTGVSALALGLAVLPQEGRVLSIDSYFEESAQTMPMGQTITTNPNYTKTSGFQTAIDLASSYGLFGTVEYGCELWPNDDNKLLTDFVKRAGPIDFVMFDGPKDDRSVCEAFKAIAPFMANKYSIFIHDYFGEHPETEVYLLEVWGQKPHNIIPTQHYPLMLLHKE